MNERDETARGLQVPRERDATLLAAILRISASLDLDTVLRAVVDGARALTGARYGVITTVDRDGQSRDFVTAGFTADEHRAMEEWPDRLRLFGQLRRTARAAAAAGPRRLGPFARLLAVPGSQRHLPGG